MNDSFYTALMFAANAGHVPVVQALLAANVPLDELWRMLNYQDGDGRTALIIASSSGHDSVVTALMEPLRSIGGQLLLAAVQQGSIDRMLALLGEIEESGFSSESILDAIISCNFNGKSPLIAAVKSERVDVVMALVREMVRLHSIPVEEAMRIRAVPLSLTSLFIKPDKKGNTPLHWAAYRGNIEIFRVLLDHIASDRLSDALNAVNRRGDTALMMGAFHGNELIVKEFFSRIRGSGLVVRRGALDHMNHQGFSVLMCAAHHGGENILRAVLQEMREVFDGSARLAVLNDTDHWGKMALMRAAKRGHIQAFKIILEAMRTAGASDPLILKALNTVDLKGRSALHLSISKKHKDIVSSIVKMWGVSATGGDIISDVFVQSPAIVHSAADVGRMASGSSEDAKNSEYYARSSMLRSDP